MHMAGPLESNLSCLAWEILLDPSSTQRQQASPPHRERMGASAVGPCHRRHVGSQLPSLCTHALGWIRGNGCCVLNFPFVMGLCHVGLPPQDARVRAFSTPDPDRIPAFCICLALATLVL